MKRRLCAPLVLGILFSLSLSLSGQAAQVPPRRLLPQVTDAPFVFDSPLPASRAVSASWFSDALFIGDARLEELADCGAFQPGLTLAQVGLNLRDLRSGTPFSRDGARVSLWQLLEGTSFQKVYLTLGFNEASWMGEEEFYAEYSALIDELRRALPGCPIYLQTLIPVTVSRSAVQTPDNALLASRSALLKRLAREKQVYLVAVDAGFTEANGALSPGLSSDGLHLTAKGNQQWYQYLRTHTMGT